MRHAMKFIRDEMNLKTTSSPETWAQIISALFDKIHPLAIGAIEQSYALSKLTARSCLETHMDAQNDAEKIESIIDTLYDDYMSHQYRISRQEAKNIGLNVVTPGVDVKPLCCRFFSTTTAEK